MHIENVTCMYTVYGIASMKRDLAHVFFIVLFFFWGGGGGGVYCSKFKIFFQYSRSLKCPLQSYSISRSTCHGVVRYTFLISHAFQRKHFDCEIS